MDLKKALSYVAVGYLFILINFNLTLNGHTLNIMPAFVGWILFFLAFDHFGFYAEGKTYLKWGFLGIAVLSAAQFVYNMIKPELAADRVFAPIVAAAGTILMFFLFGILEKVAYDYSRRRVGTICTLKFMNLALYLLLTLLDIILGGMLPGGADPVFSGTALALGSVALVSAAAAFVVAIVTMITLFRLKREVSEKLNV